MRARLVTLSLCLSVLLVLPSQANEKPTPEYQKAMKELGTVNNHLRNSLKDIDFAAIEKDAAAMKAIFAAVLGYWQEKKVDDAIKLSQDGIKAATDLEPLPRPRTIPASWPLRPRLPAPHHREKLVRSASARHVTPPIGCDCPMGRMRSSSSRFTVHSCGLRGICGVALAL